jgi:hypothetical protein
MGWPQFGDTGAAWWTRPSMDTAGPMLAPPVSHFPLPGWPAQTTVEYLTKLIALGLLLLALPYLIGRLIMHPAELLVDVGVARAARPPG